MAQQRKTSHYYTNREYERNDGYTPDLLKNPIRVPIGYYTSRINLWIVYSDGRSRTATPVEEEAWADGTLNLPRIVNGGRYELRR